MTAFKGDHNSEREIADGAVSIICCSFATDGTNIGSRVFSVKFFESPKYFFGFLSCPFLAWRSLALIPSFRQAQSAQIRQVCEWRFRPLHHLTIVKTVLP